MHNLRRVFAVVALVLVLAPLLASAPLFDPDEGLHAAIAQEMVRRGDYVTPRFLGEPFLDKPILFFWTEAASLRLFGDTETAVRLPPLLFGLAGMFTVAWLGRALFGGAVGLVSGIVYGTMLLPFAVSQIAVHDIGLVPFMCMAAWCLAAIGLPADPPSPRRLIVLAVIAGVCLGLSILTKGLAGMVVAGLFGACLVACRPATLIRVAIALTIAVVVAVLVAAPWYFAMEQAHPGYLHYYFVERHVQGYLTATQRHAGRPFWYYVPIVLGGALPWSLHLVGALQSATKEPALSERSESNGRLRLALWGWLALGLVFLSAGESKLATYALPLFPAIAIAIGEYIYSASAGRMVWVQTVLLALLPAAALIAFETRYEKLPSSAWVPIVLFGVLALDAGRRARRATEGAIVVKWLAQASICSLLAMTTLLPRVASWMTSRDLAAALNERGTLPSRVSVVDERIGSLVFYLAPALRAEATRERLVEAAFWEAISRARHDPEDAVLAIRNRQLDQFNRAFADPPSPDTKAGTFTLFRAGTLRRALSGATR